MNVGEVCNREVVVIEQTESILDAARLMRQFHVGDLVIIRTLDGRRRPVGILTDRDLVLEVVAAELDPAGVTAGDLFTRDRLVTVSVDDDIASTLEVMRNEGIRRVPVMDIDDSLAGIISVDDILELIADQLAHIAGLTPQQLNLERKERE